MQRHRDVSAEDLRELSVFFGEGRGLVGLDVKDAHDAVDEPQGHRQGRRRALETGQIERVLRDVPTDVGFSGGGHVSADPVAGFAGVDLDVPRCLGEPAREHGLQARRLRVEHQHVEVREAQQVAAVTDQLLFEQLEALAHLEQGRLVRVQRHQLAPGTVHRIQLLPHPRHGGRYGNRHHLHHRLL